MPKLLHARAPQDTEEGRKIRKLAGSRHAPGDWITRARIVSLSWEGLRTARIAEELGCHPKTVRKRLHRFNAEGIDGSGSSRSVPARSPCALRPPERSLTELTQEAELEAPALGLDPISGAPIVGALPGVNVVQIAVSDGKTEQGSDRVVFFLARSVPEVTIESIDFNPRGPDVPREHVLLRNDGHEAIELGGWTLQDLVGHTYTFPPFTLEARTRVRVWTGSGNNDAENLYWGRRQAVWNNPGDSAILRDATGREIDRYSYVPQRRPA